MPGRRADESALLRALLLRASQLGARLFRNNVGSLPLPEGGRLVYGLCPGSPDLVGWLPVTITPEMVGQTLAVFVGVEAKTETGRVRPQQRAFLTALHSAGAIAGVVRAEPDLEMLLAPWVARQP